MADTLWKESFTTPDMGVWGNDSSICSDFSMISSWRLEYSTCSFENEEDYIKTTSTSGGRLEARDFEGEGIWISEWISIIGASDIKISLVAKETGTGNNIEKKYLKAYYRIDLTDTIPFSENGICQGNWGELIISENGHVGDSLQIIVLLRNEYSSDKIILDEVTVEGILPLPEITATHINIVNAPDTIVVGKPFSIQVITVDSLESVDPNFSDSLLIIDAGQNISIIPIAKKAVNGICLWDSLVASSSGQINLEIAGANLRSTYFIIVAKEPAIPWFYEDFEKGSITHWLLNSGWEASKKESLSGNYSLHHSELAQNSPSTIFYPINTDINCYDLEWSFQLKNGDWHPSSSNKFWVYLASDQTNPGTLNGWAVGVNIKGSSDTLQLWRIKNGNADSLLINTTFYWNAETNIRLITKRTNRGNWTLTLNEPDGTFIQKHSGADKTTFDFQFTGFSFHFTSSRAGQLWADDLVIDKTPAAPFLQSIEVCSTTNIILFFNDSIDESTIIPENFSIINSLEEKLLINSVAVSENDPHKIEIHFEEQDSLILFLNISGLKGRNGKDVENGQYGFQILPKAKQHSIVINEIFPDPSPSIGLPECEYIELFNREKYPVALRNLFIQIDDKSYTIGNSTINSEDFLVLCSDKTGFNTENIYEMTNFPTLKNSGATITLIDTSELIIDQISYSDEWFTSSEKKEGGWSLERIDPNRFCGQDENWSASINTAGGTPGIQNSVLGENSDLINPEIESIEVITSNTIKLVFSEEIQGLSNKENYYAEELGSVDSIIQISNNQVILTFYEDFLKNKEYILKVYNLADDCGNLIDEDEVEFQLEYIFPDEILLSEILFNPVPGCSDFVELYNTSDRIIDLKSLSLATKNDTLELKQISPLSNETLLFYPEEYLAFTTDSLSIISYYLTSDPARIFNIERLPSFPDDEAWVVLLNDSMEVVDEFHYSESMHHPLINEKEGVSLERVSFEQQTDDLSNWASASSSVGFATPGLPNSQEHEETPNSEKIAVEPKVFSPNNDGYNDRLYIHYNLEEPGYMANVFIFNSLGQHIYQPAKNETLTQEGNWFWDGINSSGNRVPLGPYIVLVELYNQEGKVLTFKEPCLLTDRLE